MKIHIVCADQNSRDDLRILGAFKKKKSANEYVNEKNKEHQQNRTNWFYFVKTLDVLVD